MSSIYIQEPPTSGKVVLETSVGDIDVELWCKEAPRTCRNFLQLCLDGYYSGCLFHRVVPGFIAQTGDPTGTGDGGESIYGAPFRDEFHSRLRFVRRGLLAMANGGRHDNGSQFFFTLAPAPELQNKHTIFGKVSGATLYNVLKLEDGELEGDRPVYPHKIVKADVLLNPFDDIVRRQTTQTESDSQATAKSQSKPKAKSAATKNFQLLSFGDEAELEEEESQLASRHFAAKSKSSHDLANDPRLSATPAVAASAGGTAEEGATSQAASSLESVRKKLKTDSSSVNTVPSETDSYRLFQDSDQEKADKLAETKAEYEELKRSMLRSKQEKAKVLAEEKSSKKSTVSPVMQEYRKQLDEFSVKKKALKSKGSSREEQTLAMLTKFRAKLCEAKETHCDESAAAAVVATDESETVDDNDDDTAWMWHRLEADKSALVLARDASTKQDDWYDIYDPRNELNKRRRETNKKQ